MKTLIAIVTWGLALLSSLSLSMSRNPPSIDIFFLILMFIIIARIIYVVKKKQLPLYIDIINIILPFFYCAFLTLRNHVDFGGGDTNGILGYETPLGVLTFFNVPKTTAFIFLCIFYIFINISFILKYYSIVKKNNILKISIIIIMLIICFMVMINGIVFYSGYNSTSGWFVLSSVLYWIFYYAILILKKAKEKMTYVDNDLE